MDKEEQPSQQNVSGQGNIVAQRNLHIDKVIQHFHQHPRLIVGLLVVLLLGGMAFGYHRVRRDQTQDKQHNQLLQILGEFREAKDSQRQLGSADTEASLTARAYELLERKHGLKPGTLAQQFPPFVDRLLKTPGLPDLIRAQAAYAKQQFPEAERLALKVKDQALATAGGPVQRAIEALELAASAAVGQIQYARALDHLRAAAVLCNQETEPLIWARVHGFIGQVLWRHGHYSS